MVRFYCLQYLDSRFHIVNVDYMLSRNSACISAARSVESSKRLKKRPLWSRVVVCEYDVTADRVDAVRPLLTLELDA